MNMKVKTNPANSRAETATRQTVMKNDFIQKVKFRRRVLERASAQRELICRQVDFHPALDLTQESTKRILTGFGGKIGFAGIVQGAGIVFELLRKLLKKDEPSPVESDVELGDRPVRTASFLNIVIKKPSPFYVTTENPAHEQRI